MGGSRKRNGNRPGGGNTVLSSEFCGGVRGQLEGSEALGGYKESSFISDLRPS